jgi:hypothetical protein
MSYYSNVQFYCLSLDLVPSYDLTHRSSILYGLLWDCELILVQEKLWRNITYFNEWELIMILHVYEEIECK